MVFAITRGQVQQDACTGVATAFTILSILIVALRTYVRTRTIHNFGKDDFCMIVALIFTIGYTADIWVMRENGMGYSGRVLHLYQMRILVQTTLAIQIMYYTIVAFVKISICFCYLRIAADKSFARLCKGTIYFLATFWLICVIVCLTQCTPLREMWNFTGTPLGTCVNTTALFYTTSSIHIMADIWILALPVKTLLKVQRARREKIGLIVVFGLGIFSTISSIVRLHSIRIYTQSPDPFYDAVPINLWSIIEVNIGIWCASIPALKVLIIRHRASVMASRNRTFNSHSVGGSERKRSIPTQSASETEGSTAVESFDMGSVDLTSPEHVARCPSKGDDEWGGGSEEALYFPGVYSPTLRLPV